MENRTIRSAIRRMRWDMLFICGAVLIALLLLWRLPMGMADADEAFYITVPFRLLKGDFLLTDEWHVSQLSGFLLVPFMALFRLLKGDTQGIVLAFRCFWLVVHLSVMVAGYLLMRSRSRGYAAAASWIYGLTCPFSVMALSYNSMGLAAVYLLAILFFMGYCSRGADIAKGVLLAAAVLCNPYCVILYGFVLLGALLHARLRIDDQLDVRHIVWLHAGILLLLVPFVIHVLSGMDSLQQVVLSLQAIVRDPEHQMQSFFAHSWESLVQTVGDRAKFFILYAALLLGGFPIRRLRPFALAGIALWCGYNAMWDARWLTYSWGMNSAAFYLWFTGIAVFLYDEERRLREGLYALLLPLLYAVCMNTASNQRFHVIAFAVTPGTCLSVLMLGRYARKHALRLCGFRLPYLTLTAAVVLAVQLCASGYVRTHHFFWEYPKDNPLTEEITQGPLQGIMTRPENKEKYDLLYQAVAELGDVRDQQILFYPTIPAAYLMADCRIAAPSAWMTFANPEHPRLLSYYALNPEKTPDIVFVDRTRYPAWQEKEYERYAEKYGYQIERLDEQVAVLRR